MVAKEIKNKKEWDGLVTAFADYTFLQGWNWGEFNSAQGERVWRMAFFEGEACRAVCQAVSVRARRGNFLFIPHGPLVLGADGSLAVEVLKAFKDIALKGNFIFLRVSPWMESSEEGKALFAEQGFRPAPTHMHAEETWLLPLDKEEQVLLAEMRKTTRNLVRRAEREGVEISMSRDMRDIAHLIELQDETAERHNFVPFSRSYLENEFRIFSADDQALLFLGRHEGKVSSAAIIIFYGNRAFYFQSGSVKSDAPVSYLLQWEVIKEAKRRGCVLYNLWGVAPEHKPRHRFAGITTFKSGFGGYRKDYMHAQDLPLTKKYWLVYLLEKLPRTLRKRLSRKNGS